MVLKKLIWTCIGIFLMLACMGIWFAQSLLAPNLKQSYASAATTAGTGLKGEYYDNMDLTGLKLTQTDDNVNFNWGLSAPDASMSADTFSVRWTGMIEPKYSETYTFLMVADDGVRLWVDNQLLIDKWVTQASELTSGPIALKAGQKYNIHIEYFENGGGATAALQWLSASQTKQDIPQTQLYPPKELSGTGLKGEYYDNMDLTGLKLTRTDANLNFSWGTGSPYASIGADTFSVRWTGTIKPKYSETYTFYIVSDDGVRLWVDGQLLIDKWVAQAIELTSQPIALKAGHNYDIRIEYFENGGGATAILQWSSATQTKQIVPQSQLDMPADLPGVGLKGEYYDSMDLTSLKMTRTDPTVDFNWGENSPDTSVGSDTFSSRWTGRFKPQYSEAYTFYLNADDGVRLWIDGKLVLNRWENQAGQFQTSPIRLAANQKYEIQIEYFENLGGAAIGLMWSSPSQAKQFVPQSQLYVLQALSGVGLQGKYYNSIDLSGSKLIRTDANINFNWGVGPPDSSIASDRFSVQWMGTIKPKYNETYTFYAVVDDGVRLWVDGHLILDRWINQAGEFTSIAISLNADQKYEIKMEYFENLEGATARLLWSSPTQGKQVVPQSQLYLPSKTYAPVEYHYDSGGRLEYIQSSDGTITRYDYDENGNLIRKSN